MITKETVYEINVLKEMKIPLDLVNDEYDYVYDKTLLFGYISQMSKKKTIMKKENPLNFLRTTILENSKYNNFKSQNKESVNYIDQVLRVAKNLIINLE